MNSSVLSASKILNFRNSQAADNLTVALPRPEVLSSALINVLSMDLATAISVEITGAYESVNDVCSPLEFIHMKPAIQGWPKPPESWQDAVSHVLNANGEMVVSNIKQSKLFHYVEKNFLTKKIISRLEELSDEK